MYEVEEEETRGFSDDDDGKKKESSSSERRQQSAMTVSLTHTHTHTHTHQDEHHHHKTEISQSVRNWPEAGTSIFSLSHSSLGKRAALESDDDDDLSLLTK